MLYLVELYYCTVLKAVTVLFQRCSDFEAVTLKSVKVQKCGRVELFLPEKGFTIIVRSQDSTLGLFTLEHT